MSETSKLVKCFALFLLSGFVPSPPMAAKLPAGFTETKMIGSINPTCVEVAPDGRVLLCEKTGRIRVYKDGKWLGAPLLTLDADFAEERGLLGLALDPGFSANPYVYVYYTSRNPAHNRVSRFRVAGDLAAGPEEVLIDLDNLGALRAGGWHNGGSIHFGKDGKLYIATGNNAIQANSQSLNGLLGKVLRLNPDGSIPEDNPFAKTATGRNRAIWALGLRNPFSTAIHPVTGRYFINDVGDGGFEEIDEGRAGANYGYPKAEGHAGTEPSGLTGAYSDPVSAYSHGEGCAIAGAEFYHPSSNTFGTEYLDRFFFSDYCTGWIKTLDPSGGNAVKTFATGIPRPIFLKAAPDGSLYYTCRGARASGLSAGSAEDNASTADGALYRITGPISVSLAGARGTPALVPVLDAQEKVLLPAGMHRVSLFDPAGKRVWEYAGAAAGSPVWLDLPSNLPPRIYRIRYE